MNTFDQFTGTYQGAGTWHDATGTSASYRVEQTNRATAHGFEVAFRHDFDDGTVVEAQFNMTWLAPGLVAVEVAGTTAGNGYVFEDYCHYHIKLGEPYVEVSYRADGDGLHVFGSSSTNADGNYIAWQETLRRVGD